jgi:hypothetical protein
VAKAAKASDEDVRTTFAQIVNMTPREIEGWHKTDESKSVGQDSGDGVSVGVKAGQRTLQLLRIKRAPNADDIKHMRRVISFIRRLSMQAPRKSRETSRWRYALMNWGHDPLKPSDADSPWRQCTTESAPRCVSR